jgi:hypothetical protein
MRPRSGLPLVGTMYCSSVHASTSASARDNCTRPIAPSQITQLRDGLVHALL